MSSLTTADPEHQAIADITAVLRELAHDHEDSLATLFARAQAELRRTAHRERLLHGAGETLSTTALIHEAWLKLNRGDLPPLADRRHFFALAARAMRQVLVGYARARCAVKRGNGETAQPLDGVDVGDDAAAAASLLEIGDALDRLEAVRPRLAQVVYLRFYAGLGDEDIGALLDVEQSTVRRDWLKARAWLFRHLQPDAAP